MPKNNAEITVSEAAWGEDLTISLTTTNIKDKDLHRLYVTITAQNSEDETVYFKSHPFVDEQSVPVDEITIQLPLIDEPGLGYARVWAFGGKPKIKSDDIEFSIS
jgi:hypothetical protein